MKNDVVLNPLFNALTRPQMMLGVSLDYCLLSALCAMFAFILLDNLAYLCLFIPLHTIGWIACRFDPFIFNVLFKRVQCSMTRNYSLWGCQSYDAS